MIFCSIFSIWESTVNYQISPKKYFNAERYFFLYLERDSCHWVGPYQKMSWCVVKASTNNQVALKNMHSTAWLYWERLFNKHEKLENFFNNWEGNYASNLVKNVKTPLSRIPHYYPRFFQQEVGDFPTIWFSTWAKLDFKVFSLQ